MFPKGVNVQYSRTSGIHSNVQRITSEAEQNGSIAEACVDKRIGQADSWFPCTHVVSTHWLFITYRKLDAGAVYWSLHV